MIISETLQTFQGPSSPSQLSKMFRGKKKVELMYINNNKSLKKDELAGSGCLLSKINNLKMIKNRKKFNYYINTKIINVP